MSASDRPSRQDEDYQTRLYPYQRHPDQTASTPVRHPVVVVGAGPVGMAMAIDLALQDIPVVLLDNDNRLSVGSRALCFAKRTLEIFDRLGCGQRMVDRGVSWNLGRVFHKDEPIYQFNLLPQTAQERPAFINLQQYTVEGYLADRMATLPLIDVRWKHAVVGLTPDADHVQLHIDTPDGPYTLQADHVVACDGSRSTVRGLMGLESRGRIFRDRFLIADVRMDADFPAERFFWFDPPFHPGQSVLLHQQPDGVWRVDFQLGWDADPELEKQPERIIPRVKTLLAHTAMHSSSFELVWSSVYTFACLRMASFRQGRVFFAGDAAHGVSPFGARGANSGVQDTDNLAWKLAAVIKGQAAPALLDTYGPEREFAADENILNSSRATDFITPKTEVSRLFRDTTLQLARVHAFARALVNSGRLSVPAVLSESTLNTPDQSRFQAPATLGAAALDAPVQDDQGRAVWLLRLATAGRFTALLFEGPEAKAAVARMAQTLAPQTPLTVVWVHPPGTALQALSVDPATQALAEAAGLRLVPVLDVDGLVAQRYDGLADTLVLWRPDQHLCARWRQAAEANLAAAFQRCGWGTASPTAMQAPIARPEASSPQDEANASVAESLGALRLSAPDEVYAALIEAHAQLSGTQSQALNAALVLLLANQVGALHVITSAIEAARQSVLGVAPPVRSEPAPEEALVL